MKTEELQSDPMETAQKLRESLLAGQSSVSLDPAESSDLTKAISAQSGIPESKVTPDKLAEAHQLLTSGDDEEDDKYDSKSKAIANAIVTIAGTLLGGAVGGTAGAAGGAAGAVKGIEQGNALAEEEMSREEKTKERKAATMLALKKEAGEERRHQEKLSSDKELTQMKLSSEQKIAQQKADIEAKSKMPPTDTATKLSKLTSEKEKSLNNIMMAIKGIRQLKSAYEAGESPVSIIGDNEYTLGKQNAVEGLGRMQSGGQIGPKEAANFEKLIPGFGDVSKDYDKKPEERISPKKINQFEQEMISRLRNLGFSPDEFPELQQAYRQPKKIVRSIPGAAYAAPPPPKEIDWDSMSDEELKNYDPYKK